VKRTRRGHNEGTIYQRSDGRWEAKLNVGWRGGKRHRKCFYGTTRTEVAKKLTRAILDLQSGLFVDCGRQTLESFLQRWLNECVNGPVRPLTYEQYAQHVRLYWIPELGKVQLAKLTAPRVQSAINTLKRRLSPRTIQISLFVLRRALAQAVKWDLLARNVADLVEFQRPRRPEVRPPSQEQAAALLESARGDTMEAAIVLGLSMGLRRGEILGLKWEDIDLDLGELTIRRALQRSGGRLVDGEKSKLRFIEPKSERSRRKMPVPDFVLRLLRAQRAHQAQDRLRAGSDWADQDLVFCSRKGTPFEPRRLDSVFKRMLNVVGLPQTIRLHDLRHFAASLLIHQGVHPRVVQEILGHSDIGLTMNTYGHVIPDSVREAMGKVHAVLGG
jgi:integrase